MMMYFFRCRYDQLLFAIIHYADIRVGSSDRSFHKTFNLPTALRKSQVSK